MTRNPTRFLLTVSALLMKLFRPNKQRRRRKYQSLSLTFEASQIETLELRRMFSSISVGGSEHLGQNIPNTASAWCSSVEPISTRICDEALAARPAGEGSGVGD